MKFFSTRSQEVVEMCKQVYSVAKLYPMQWQTESVNF